MFPGGKLPGEDLINSWYPIVFALVVGLIFGIRNFFKGSLCNSRTNLTGKTAIVTGGNTGMGKAVVTDFAQRGCNVILACRDVKAGEQAVEDIRYTTKNGTIKIMKLNMGSFESVKEFVREFNLEEEKLDLLINNAGIMCNPQELSQDELELHLQVNHLGHFLLTNLLVEKLRSGSPSRVVNVTCAAYRLAELNFNDLNFRESEYKPGDAYAASKAFILLCTLKMAQKLDGSGICVNAVLPGVVNTGAQRHMPFRKNPLFSIAFSPLLWFFMKTSSSGAQTTIQCAVGEEEKDVTGQLYSECLVTKIEEDFKDQKLIDLAWEKSEEMTGIAGLI